MPMTLRTTLTTKKRMKTTARTMKVRQKCRLIRKAAVAMVKARAALLRGRLLRCRPVLRAAENQVAVRALQARTKVQARAVMAAEIRHVDPAIVADAGVDAVVATVAVVTEAAKTSLSRLNRFAQARARAKARIWSKWSRRTTVTSAKAIAPH